MNKEEKYQQLKTEIVALLDNCPYQISQYANLSSLIKQSIDNVSWVGVYLYDNEQDILYLGPFQGLPACLIIKNNQGVCGKSFYYKKTIIVKNVHKFTGHIACDANSMSEIVVPLISNKKVIGVLDIDSYQEANFDNIDASNLEEIVILIDEINKKSI